MKILVLAFFATVMWAQGPAIGSGSSSSGGATGPTGPQGATGATGSPNVTISHTFSGTQELAYVHNQNTLNPVYDCFDHTTLTGVTPGVNVTTQGTLTTTYITATNETVDCSFNASGVTGASGPTGAVGATGPGGGATGATGPPGAIGPTGAAGNSVLGSTYITTSETTSSSSFVDLTTPDTVTFSCVGTCNFVVQYGAIGTVANNTNADCYSSVYIDTVQVDSGGQVLSFANPPFGINLLAAAYWKATAQATGSHTVDVKHKQAGGATCGWVYRLLLVTQVP